VFALVALGMLQFAGFIEKTSPSKNYAVRNGVLGSVLGALAGSVFALRPWVAHFLEHGITRPPWTTPDRIIPLLCFCFVVSAALGAVAGVGAGRKNPRAAFWVGFALGLLITGLFAPAPQLIRE